MSSSERPEFFLDRSLGRRTADGLRAHGWVVHLVADYYPDDADGVEDADWIARGCDEGWVLLTKDKRIRYRRHELAALDGHLFCLSAGDLTVREAIDRLVGASSQIVRAVRGEPGFWLVYGGGRVERRWP